jgi:hypothetical protein
MMLCGKRHLKRRVKLLVKFGPAGAGRIVEAKLCPHCGVSVKARQLGCSDEGFYMIPSAPAEVVEDL